MMRTAFLRWIPERYGDETVVTVPGGNPATVRAMIQTVNYENKVYLDDARMSGGYFGNSHFSYVGPPDCRLDQTNDAMLRHAEKEYKIICVQDFLAGGRILYVWAVLQELPGEETNGGI